MSETKNQHGPYFLAANRKQVLYKGFLVDECWQTWNNLVTTLPDNASSIAFTLNAYPSGRHTYKGKDVTWKMLDYDQQMDLYKHYLTEWVERTPEGKTDKKLWRVPRITACTFEISSYPKSKLHMHGIFEADNIDDLNVIHMGQKMSQLIGMKGNAWYIAARFDCIRDHKIWNTYLGKKGHIPYKYKSFKLYQKTLEDYAEILKEIKIKRHHKPS